MKPIRVIGMGMSRADLTARHLAIIDRADILVGGRRHLEYFPEVRARKKEITKDLKGTVAYIKRRMRDKTIVVLASGDPLFFGIGSLLSKSLGADNVVIYPNVSSIAAAFARIKEPWQDAAVVSLHGRQRQRDFIKAVRKTDTVAVLTDPDHHPGRLAQICIDHGITDLQICVLEQLGTDTEQHEWYDLHAAAAKHFSQPNLVIFRRTAPRPAGKRTLHLGMPETCFDHQRGLITKAEVRTVTLAKLCLATEHVLWDLGAGSGSIAVEASIFIKKGKIYAVEKDPARIAHIRTNQKRFGVKNLEIIQAVLPDGLANLSRPDRVFIGGGGKAVADIIRAASAYLRPGGVVVVNTVLINSVDTAVRTLKTLGFKTNTVQVQINRSRNMPWGQRFKAESPVWIVAAERK
jgi:precorrin-6Y C5,15-methyltransferase (decarboxylating)